MTMYGTVELCSYRIFFAQIAETQRLANIVAKRTVINYNTENLDTPVLSIEDAVRRCSYFETPPFLLPQKIGDFSKGMAEADQKIFSAEVQLPSSIQSVGESIINVKQKEYKIEKN